MLLHGRRGLVSWWKARPDRYKIAGGQMGAVPDRGSCLCPKPWAGDRVSTGAKGDRQGTDQPGRGSPRLHGSQRLSANLDGRCARRL